MGRYHGNDPKYVVLALSKQVAASEKLLPEAEIWRSVSHTSKLWGKTYACSE